MHVHVCMCACMCMCTCARVRVCAWSLTEAEHDEFRHRERLLAHAAQLEVDVTPGPLIVGGSAWSADAVRALLLGAWPLRKAQTAQPTIWVDDKMICSRERERWAEGAVNGRGG